MRRFLSKKFILSLCLVSFLLLGCFGFISQVGAQADTDVFGIEEVSNEVVLGETDIRVTIAKIIRAVLGLLGIIAVGIVLYGGWMYMTSAGSEEKVATARKILINGAIGLVIILSSFAIAQFVLTKLGEATGVREVGDGTGDDGGSFGCENVGDCLPDPGSCASDHFVVKTITPSTPFSAGDNYRYTDMANIKVRAVFSQPLSPRTETDSILILTSGGGQRFPINITLSEDRQVAEAVLNSQETCNNDQTCLAKGDYKVTVSSNLYSDLNSNGVDEEDEKLETDTDCGREYPTEADFTVDYLEGEQIDITIPAIADPGLTINEQSGEDIILRRGSSYPLKANLTDAGGIGYLLLQVAKEGGNQNSAKWYDGPRVGDGSSVPYGFEYPITIPRTEQALTRYEVSLMTYDIDHNSRTDSLNFVVLGEHCDPITGEPVSEEYADECLVEDGGDCSEDWQCQSGRCEEGVCVGNPIIRDVSPWNGAAKTWVTVLGSGFGQAVGTVEFGYDSDDDGDFDENDTWVQTALADCLGNEWQDNSVIVEVPIEYPANVSSSIRLTTSGGKSDDTSNDSGVNDLFTKDDTFRPQLCEVYRLDPEDPGRHLNNGYPMQSVRAVGRAFGGDPDMFFGGVEAPVISVGETIMETRVPENMAPGAVGAYVIAGGAQSNGVRFEVLDPTLEYTPRVTAVDPASATGGSLITIYGQRFDVKGTNSRAVLVDNLDILNNCFNSLDQEENTDEDGCFHLQLDIRGCGVNWNENQIVAELPKIIAPGSYYLGVKNRRNLASDGRIHSDNQEETLIIEDGEPLPGLCSLEPIYGPAPRSSGSPLNISGLGLSGDTVKTYFWKSGASLDNMDSWLNSSPLAGSNDSLIKTTIPIDGEGYSMISGPIRVGVDGRLSNSLLYEVIACDEAGGNLADNLPRDQYQCCAAQPGSPWRRGVCSSGESQTAGYVWRFTTGFMPEIPYVVEECNEAQWNDANVRIAFPSPTPWERWRRGEEACVNSTIGLRFSMEMDESSVENNIEIYTCGTGETADCTDETKVGVTGQFDIFSEERIVRILPQDNGALTENTWYHVELLKDVKSVAQASEFGVATAEAQPLKKTRACGDGTAYCFDFKTSEAVCKIVGAGIQPPSYTTHLLGELPFYYYLWGRGDQECSVLNVNGLGWRWSSADNNKATVELANDNDGRYINTRARGTALADAPEGVEIKAAIDASENLTDMIDEDIEAISNLFIDLVAPKVINYWPNCGEACINVGIGARFSRQMMVGSYQDNIKVEECISETCAELVGGSRINLDVTESSDNRELHAYLPRDTVLLTNTWYLVTVEGLDEEDGVVGVVSLGQLSPERSGRPMEGDFSWKFRTKADNTLCQVNRVRISPDPFVARLFGEKTKYSAFPYSSADQCSPYGQELNPWTYGWDWSVDDRRVARISDFTFQGITAPFCSLSCLTTGSDIAKGVERPYLCGNGIVEPGEDCDIAGTMPDGQAEIPGVSCTLSCLRPGSTGDSCGNNQLDINEGEECDPGLTSFCTSNCLWEGSSRTQPSGDDLARPWCGSGSVTKGEDCDINDPGTQAGCSQNCLHLGTAVSQAWCDANVQFRSMAECQTAISACGNGILENGEDCELVGPGRLKIMVEHREREIDAEESICNESCLLENICGVDSIPNIGDGGASGWPGEEGSNDDCTLAGSSVTYRDPSLCGDGVVGVGENPNCEFRSTGTVLGENPVQVVTAVGQSAIVENDSMSQKTNINAAAVSQLVDFAVREFSEADQIKGSGKYYVQCGYKEYPEILNGNYNSCRENADNSQGVADNSCCYERPIRKSEYPVADSGIDAGSEPVCRNTLISVTFDKFIDESTLANNIIVADGYPEADFDCASIGEVNVTNLVPALAYNDSQPGFWGRVWQKVKSFFARLFGGEAYAMPARLSDVKTWCAGRVNVVPELKYNWLPDGTAASTTISLYIDAALEANTFYAVVLQGGPEGIKDSRGVSIKHQDPAQNIRKDVWNFKTGDTICKLKEITVEPKSHLFQYPFATSSFYATAHSTTGQEIVPISDIYNWQWLWGPRENNIFDIPVEDADANAFNTIIGARNVEGELTGYVRAKVTVDIETRNNHVGQVFSDTVDLVASFCERPWPGRINNNEWFPFKNDEYNFSMSYCADSGRSGITADDLPFLGPDSPYYVDVTVNEPGDSLTLVKYLFFNEINDDVIGVQIFQNPERLSARDWYLQQGFGNIADMQSITVAGYSGITDGSNYYINALNQEDSDFGREPDGSRPLTPANNEMIWNNIYLFSINPNASATTRQVFDQLIDSIKFNTNITDLRYCSVDEYNACSSDFDCLGLGEDGIDVDCQADKTKLLRDWQRLQDIKTAQENLDLYYSSNNKYPDMAGGTFVPGYTVSKWSSWGRLGSIINGLPSDPLNIWVGCTNEDENANAQTCWNAEAATYACPAESSVYEYEFVNNGNYELHAPLEYIDINNPTVEDFIDKNKFTIEPWCTPTQIFSPAVGRCGDGFVNLGEACDPSGSSRLSSYGGVEVDNRIGECQEMNRQCLIEDDCSLTVVRQISTEDGSAGEDEYKIGLYSADEVCVYQNYILYATIGFNNKLKVFPCNTDQQCRESSFYDVDIIYSLTKPPLEITKAQINSSDGNYNCLEIQDSRNYKLADGRIIGGTVPSTCNIEGDIEVVPTDCPIGKKALDICNDSCQWNYGSCLSQTNCGNGVVEPGESCDDGALNGTYGHCNASCGGWSDFCGDREKQDEYEFCDWSIEGDEIETYNLDREKSCSWDCQSYGSYCGDGVVQEDRDENDNRYEECDDQNTEELDGCTNKCKKENIACKNAGPYFVTTADSTEIFISREVGENYDVFYESEGEYNGIPIPECTQETTGKQICAAYGLGCEEVNKRFQKAAGWSVGCIGSPSVCGVSCNLDLTSIVDNRTIGYQVVCDDVYEGPVPEQGEVVEVGCGNGVVEDGESCDLGNQNGIACTPGYNQSCTYCSRDCLNVLTKEPDNYCGDGEIQIDQGEVCDERDDVLTRLNDQNDPDSGITTAGCPDVGEYICAADCGNFTDNCEECIPKEDAPEPWLAVLNPMIGNDIDRTWGKDNGLALYRLAANDPFLSPFNGVLLCTADGGTNTYDCKIAHGELSPEEEGLGLETNTLCSQEYFVYFNYYNIWNTVDQSPQLNPLGDEFDYDNINARDYLIDTPLGPMINASADYFIKRYGDFFYYPVDGEVGAVKKEMVVSPAVPPDNFRVVVKWTDVESNNRRVEFMGLVYSENSNFFEMVGNSNIKIASYSWASARAKICDKIEKISANYWYSKIENDGCGPFGNRILIHDFGSLEKTFIQSVTMDMVDSAGSEPYAFFVEAQGESGPIPIYDFRNSNLQVEIYEYHEGQIPEYSIYQPTQIFSIRTAAGTSTNPAARYWHVFNLVKDPLSGKFRVVPVEQIQTGWCDVLNSVPGSSCTPQ